MHKSFTKIMNSLLLGLCLMIPATGWTNTIEEKPGALAMSTDAIVVRPAMLVTTLLGAGVFIVSSPFSALGGNIGEAWEVLVEGPFETTFVRCLGCTMNGRKVSAVVEQKEESEAEAE